MASKLSEASISGSLVQVGRSSGTLAAADRAIAVGLVYATDRLSSFSVIMGSCINEVVLKWDWKGNGHCLEHFDFITT